MQAYVDTKKTGGMVLSITQNVQLERVDRTFIIQFRASLAFLS